MAKIIKKKGKYIVVSHKYNTAGNPMKTGQKPYIIACGKNKESLRRKVRKKGYVV